MSSCKFDQHACPLQVSFTTPVLYTPCLVQNAKPMQSFHAHQLPCNLKAECFKSCTICLPFKCAFVGICMGLPWTEFIGNFYFPPHDALTISLSHSLPFTLSLPPPMASPDLPSLTFTLPHPSHAHAAADPAASADLVACGRRLVTPGTRKADARKNLNTRRRRCVPPRPQERVGK